MQVKDSRASLNTKKREGKWNASVKVAVGGRELGSPLVSVEGEGLLMWIASRHAGPGWSFHSNHVLLMLMS